MCVLAQLLTARDTADLLREVQDLEQRVRTEHFRQVSAHLHMRTVNTTTSSDGASTAAGDRDARRGGRGAGNMMGAAAKPSDAVAPGDFRKPK